jgi:hypothetical protein
MSNVLQMPLGGAARIVEMRCARFRFFVLNDGFVVRQMKRKEKRKMRGAAEISLDRLHSFEARLASEHGHENGQCP